MALIDRVKERTGSDLSDSELQAMIDGIMAEIAARFGPVGPIAVERGDLADPHSRSQRILRLTRPLDPNQPVTITERDPGNSGDPAANIVLDAADYSIMSAGRILARNTSGPNGNVFWAPLVIITYTPLGEVAARDEATIKLMQLDLSYRGGLKSEKAGDYSFTLSGDQTADREAIFATLATQRGMVMA